MTNAPPIQQLLDQPALLAAAGQCASFDQPAVVAQLRKFAAAPLVHAAIELLAARRKAAGKLACADQLMLDTQGIEQASSSAVASLKAQRFAAAGLTHVIDLCSGIGGDACELARQMNVTLVDHDPSKIWMARHNVQLVTGRPCPAACADVTQLNLRDHVIHLDPARRSAAPGHAPGHVRRIHHYNDYQPGPAFIADLLIRCPTAAVKLGPGIDTELLPPGEVQFISERGSLVQAVLWTGDLYRQPRSATVIASAATSGAGGTTLTGTGQEPVPYSTIHHYLLAIDPAVERASLIGQLCARLHAAAIHPKLGLLTADAPITSPFTTCFEHLVTLPVRKVAAWLKQNDAGIVEVKTRGKAADPNSLQTQWRGKGHSPYTIFVLRHDQIIQAHITRRL